MTSVLVVDDQALIRAAVTEILNTDPNTTVVGEATNGRQALTLASRLRPDVVLMDIRMPELDGIETTRQICANPALAATRVLILTTFEEDEYLIAALRAGASGFIGKGSEPEDIVQAVLAVHSGETLLSPNATQALVRKYVLTTPAPEVPPLPELNYLTDREQEILVLVARGMSNKEIADYLVISPHTVKTHVNRIMTKIHAHDRAQLVIVAYESGLLTPGSV